MKKNIRIVTMFVLATLFFASSCSEDFLDKQPHNALSPGTFWSTTADAEAGLTAIYDALNVGRGQFGWGMMGLFDLLTPVGHCRSGSINAIAAGNHDPNGGQTRSLWENSYRGVVRANDLLVHIDQIEVSETDAALIEQYKAEAKFLRAMFYFHLADMFGDVPLFTTVPTVEDAFAEKSTKAEVLNLVKSDLDAAIAVLPETASVAGRATKGAALGMRAKVAMMEKDWSTAQSNLNQIMTLGYELETDYAEIFDVDNEGNGEVIFDIQYIFANDAESGNTFEKLFGNRSAEASGWSWVQPGLWFVEKFEHIDENPEYTIEDDRISAEIYDYFEGRDPRMDATILRPGAHFLDYRNISILHPYEMRNLNHSQTKLQMRKYVIDGDYDRTLSNDSPLNWIVLRYADILLMKAEVEAQLAGGAGAVSQDVLDATINKVRQRASDKLPLYTAGNITMENIQDEYVRELGFEGWMYFNYKRWQLLEMNDGFEVRGLTVNNSGVSFNASPIQTRVFESPKHYFFPIPTSEMERAENLTQNPVWE
ncbi:RagB/SusD family nutrient uptake outer membrane protein [Prolixibacteraceae bacterium JC049]|nr:RagB/SusD family nutrient uptake outer membrane protein [Prolixibacteraceae bacterium JC049]